MALHIALSNSAGTPIYQQIEDQIRQAILAGDLAQGEQLPSIRALARDLQVSVITTTRAYNDLAQAGYIVNVPGKGSYVQPTNTELLREHLLRQAEEHLTEAVHLARQAGVDAATLHHMLDLTFSEGALQ